MMPLKEVSMTDSLPRVRLKMQVSERRDCGRGHQSTQRAAYVCGCMMAVVVVDEVRPVERRSVRI